MKRISVFALTFMLAATPSASFAQESVGFRLDEILKDITGPLIFFISMACLIGGIGIAVKGLMKLKDSGGQSSETGPALAMLLAATLLIALPEAAGVGMLTMTGSNTGIISQSDIRGVSVALDDSAPQSLEAPSAPWAAPVDCYSSGEPVPCMAANVAKNVVPIGVVATFVVAFIAGLWGLGHSLFELTKVQGGRPLPEGWGGKIIFNIVLLNASFLFQTVSQTILGQGGTVGAQGVNTSHSLLKYQISNSAALEQYQTLIGHVFTIMALFGVFAFVRGVFICKAAGEGRQGGTYSHGFIFMIAGILLANSKLSTCLVLNTLLGSSGTFGFCSGVSA